MSGRRRRGLDESGSGDQSRAEGRGESSAETRAEPRDEAEQRQRQRRKLAEFRAMNVNKTRAGTRWLAPLYGARSVRVSARGDYCHAHLHLFTSVNIFSSIINYSIKQYLFNIILIKL